MKQISFFVLMAFFNLSIPALYAADAVAHSEAAASSMGGAEAFVESEQGVFTQQLEPDLHFSLVPISSANKEPYAEESPLTFWRDAGTTWKFQLTDASGTVICVSEKDDEKWWLLEIARKSDPFVTVPYRLLTEYK